MIPANQIGPGRSGLIMEEPLLWEKGNKGRCGMSIPVSDVPEAAVDPAICGDGPDFPDLSEVDVIRHYTRLSQWNYGVDTGLMGWIPGSIRSAPAR